MTYPANGRTRPNHVALSGSTPITQTYSHAEAHTAHAPRRLQGLHGRLVDHPDAARPEGGGVRAQRRVGESIVVGRAHAAHDDARAI